MTALSKVVIWGAGGHARVVADVVRLAGQYEIAAFIDDVGSPSAETFCGAPLIHSRDELLALKRQGLGRVLVAIGDNAARYQLGTWAENEGFGLISAVHPAATIAHDAVLGRGTVVMAGAVVNAAARVDGHAIINTVASVDHDCVVEEAVHLCPGARLGGHAHVGRQSQVSMNSTVINRIRIGEGVVIGAGSVVVRDLPDRVVAYGNPARIVRENPHVAQADD